MTLHIKHVENFCLVAICPILGLFALVSRGMMKKGEKIAVVGFGFQILRSFDEGLVGV